MRPSIDWPHWPTTTRSSIRPCRSGPNISSHGRGREPWGVRNVAGIRAQEELPSEPFTRTVRSKRGLVSLKERSSAMVHDLLSDPLAPWHDIRRDGACQIRVVKMQKLAGIKAPGAAFLLFMV